MAASALDRAASRSVELGEKREIRMTGRSAPSPSKMRSTVLSAAISPMPDTIAMSAAAAATDAIEMAAVAPRRRSRASVSETTGPRISAAMVAVSEPRPGYPPR
jgi:hypothetical protein